MTSFFLIAAAIIGVFALISVLKKMLKLALVLLALALVAGALYFQSSYFPQDIKNEVQKRTSDMSNDIEKRGQKAAKRAKIAVDRRARELLKKKTGKATSSKKEKTEGREESD